MRPYFIRLFAVGLALAACAAPAVAQQADDSGTGQRVVRGQLGASINNAGLQNTLELAWIRARMSAGIVHTVTPAQMRLGGWVQLSPLPIFDLRAGVDPSAYFGTFNSLQGFDTYDDAFDKEARDVRAGSKAGLAVRAYVAPTLKMRAGPFVGAMTAEFEWWRSNAGGPLFYEPTRDTLLKSSGDRLVTTNTVAMHRRAIGEGALSLGAIHTLTRVFDARQNDIQKAGAIAVREFAGTHFRLPRPRLTLVVARYLDDRSKDGQWTAAAAVGFRTR